MLKNFLLISLRSIIKNKGGAYFNLLGLTFGMASCLYIFNYQYFELSFDQQVGKSAVFRAETHSYSGKLLQNKSAFTSQNTAKFLSQQLAGIESYTRLTPFSEEGSALFKLTTTDSVNHKVYIKPIYYADTSIFDVFSIQLVEGVKRSQDPNLNSILLSVSAAKDLLSKIKKDKTGIIGKELQSGGKGILDDTYTIVGIFEDRHTNTHLPFEALVIPAKNSSLKNDTLSHENSYTYFSFPSSKELIAQQINLIPTGEKQLFFRPIDKIHITSEISNEPTAPANSALLFFLGMMGVVIMLLASTNYINNAIINSIYRAKEIGIRKVLGIRPVQLITTFLGEALLMNLFAVGFCVFLFQFGRKLTLQWTELVYPAGGEIPIHVQFLFLALLLIISTLLSSVYPAYYLSSLNPISSLRSKINVMDSNQAGGANTIIKSLLVFQLAASIVFLSSVYIVHKQLSYLETQDKQPFDVRMSGIFPGSSGANGLFSDLAVGFADELDRGNMIDDVQFSNLSKGTITTAQSVALLHPDDRHFDAENNTFSFYVIDHSYWGRDTKKFLAGRNFLIAFGKDPNHLILNESAMHQLGYQEPDSLLGKQLLTRAGEQKIIGIVKDESEAETPAVYATGFRFRTYVDLTVNYPGQAGESVTEFIEKVEHLLASRLPFLYFFDRGFQQQRAMENTMLILFSFFSLLAILISSIGMIGLSFFVTQKRTKEVGIRKILGASSGSILLILLFDFLKLILYASLFAIPIVIIGGKMWLENYAYRIPIGPLAIGLPVLVILFICLVVTLEKCYKAAFASPVKVLEV